MRRGDLFVNRFKRVMTLRRLHCRRMTIVVVEKNIHDISFIWETHARGVTGEAMIYNLT